MGLVIELQDERGEALQSLSDPRNLLGRLLRSDESSLLVTSIDPYGDTIFNRIQMERFLREWRGVVSAKAQSSEERTLVAAIESMAVHCNDGVHLYLKFIGD